MNELEELKLQWSETSLRVAQLEQDKERLTAELRETKLQPSLHRLASSYRNMCIWSCLMLAATYPMFYWGWSKLFNVSVGLIAMIWTAVMLISAVGDMWLYRHVKEINVAKMTVDEVSIRALRCRRVHLSFQALLIPLLIVFIWVVYIQIPTGRTGMLIGGIIGGIFGIKKWLQLMRAYKSIIVE